MEALLFNINFSFSHRLLTCIFTYVFYFLGDRPWPMRAPNCRGALEEIWCGYKEKVTLEEFIKCICYKQ
jgi:hypothetical protein